MINITSPATSILHKNSEANKLSGMIKQNIKF